MYTEEGFLGTWTEGSLESEFTFNSVVTDQMDELREGTKAEGESNSVGQKDNEAEEKNETSTANEIVAAGEKRMVLRPKTSNKIMEKDTTMPGHFTLDLELAKGKELVLHPTARNDASPMPTPGSRGLEESEVFPGLIVGVGERESER